MRQTIALAPVWLVVAFLPVTLHAAQRAAKKVAGGGAGVAAVLAGQSEAEKSRAFMKMRKDVTPAEVLALLRAEPSEMIAGMAVGCCLENSRLSPRDAAEMLWTLAQRPDAAGLAATLGAVSGQAAAIAEVLVGLPSRPGPANPHLLAAEILATYATVVEQGSPAAADKPGRAGGAGKKRREAVHFDQQSAAAAAGPLGTLLKSKEAEVLEAAILACARLRLRDLQPALEASGLGGPSPGRAPRYIDPRAEARAAGVAGARLLYRAKIGAPVPDELLAQVFAPAPKAPGARTPPRGPAPEPRLFSYAIRTPPLTYGCQALGAATDLPQEKRLPRLHEALNHRDLRVQSDAARAIEAVGSEESVPALLEKVTGDTPWPVLVPVLSALGAIPSKTAIPVLLDRLEKEKGRFRLDVNYALASIVGGQHGTTAAEWRTWWQQNEAAFAVDKTRTTKFREEKSAADMRVPPLGSFYNMDIASDRVVFVVDTSMSMHGEKISSLKNHLGQTVGSLAAHVEFNVVDFGGVISLMKTYALITKSEIPVALERIKQMTLTGGTRAYDAMEVAMALAGTDTLILLSDGAPVGGKFDAWPRLIAAMGILTRYWPVAIWGLEFSTRGANHASMQELAARNHARSCSSEP